MNKSNLRAVAPDRVGVGYRVRDDVEPISTESESGVGILGNVFARDGK